MCHHSYRYLIFRKCHRFTPRSRKLFYSANLLIFLLAPSDNLIRIPFITVRESFMHYGWLSGDTSRANFSLILFVIVHLLMQTTKALPASMEANKSITIRHVSIIAIIVRSALLLRNFLLRSESIHKPL